MSHIQFKHPWNAGYAIPQYVLAEPQGRGTFTTRQAPRGTISRVPRDLRKTGFAVPKYAQRRFGKNPLVTKMIPRRTVSALAPDIFGRPAANGQGPVENLIAVGSSLDGSSIGGSTLGDFAPGTSSDPILNYGKQGAAWIMTEAKKLPAAERVREVKKLLHAISPNLPGDVEHKTKLYMKQGRSPKDAFQRALAASLSNRAVAEFVRLGSGTMPDPLGDFWSTVASPFKAVGKGVGKAGSLAVKGVKKLGGLTCGVAKSPVGIVAGGATGGPAGAAGVQVVAGMCPAGTVPIQPDGGGGGGGGLSSLPLMPIALVGGALVLVVALK